MRDQQRSGCGPGASIPEPTPNERIPDAEYARRLAQGLQMAADAAMELAARMERKHDWRNNPFENYTAFCDRCSFDRFYDFATWSEVIQDMKNDGWRIHKVDGDWEHLCPTCAGRK